MESDTQNNSAVSAGAISHDQERQTGEEGCYIENGNQYSACLPTILESGLIFSFPSRNVALILEEKDTLQEESSNDLGKGFMESGFINQGRERNVDVEVRPQNPRINQGDIDQGMKSRKSTVEPAGNLQEATQHADALTAFYTEKKEFQNPEQQLEELGVEEDQQMHEIHDSKDKESCSNPGPSSHVDQNQISSSIVSKQSVHQVTDSGNDCRAQVSLGSETVPILEYQQKYLQQDSRCQDFNDYYSKKMSKCTDNNVAGKNYRTQSSHGQDQKIQIRDPAPVDCTSHCCAQPSDVQSEIVQSASHSCTREPKLDSEMSLQVPSQLIEMQVPTQGSHDTSTRTRSTCTVDLLTIVFLQLLLMPAVFQYFKDSQHYIYNHEVPRFHEMFVRRRFDDIRLEWVLKLQERFWKFEFLWRPPEGRLNLQILEQLLFTAFYHERQDNANPLYQDDQNGSPPPLIIADFTDAHLNLVNVGKLAWNNKHWSVQILCWRIQQPVKQTLYCQDIQLQYTERQCFYL
ncbi:unnamed protein product [Mytilus edulis]|uniref:Uncharacterized protein n=1 Tax=Mytilus edulis TaxID=6550 RepID=A0A8S3PNN6_MYTED|nr:unnamed protein product [Mytilus edulis]